MWYNLLADKTREIPIGEAALYALLGFSVVFVGISFLIGIVWLVGKVMQKASLPKKGKAASKHEEAVAKPVTADGEEVSEETVAVITAALMAYYQQNNPKCEFTVKRIKRI